MPSHWVSTSNLQAMGSVASRYSCAGGAELAHGSFGHAPGASVDEVAEIDEDRGRDQ